MTLSYFSILRPVNGIMSIISVWIGTLVAGLSLYPNIATIFGFLSVFFISGAGMIINDYFDIETDKINKPKRPLPSGKISKKTALIYADALFLIGNGFAFLISTTAFSVSLTATILLILYAARLKKVIMAGHLVVSFLVALGFIFGGVIANNFLPAISLALLAFLSNTGREIYKAIEDAVGDKKQGTITVAVKYGVFKARKIAYLFLISAVVLSFLPYVLGIFGLTYLFFVIIADMVFLSAVAMPKHGSFFSKAGMLVALIAFLAGALA